MLTGNRQPSRPRLLAVLLVGALWGLAARGASLSAFDQQTPAPPTGVVAERPGDAEFARLVREWTTKPEFLGPLVDHLPIAPGVPSPKDILGYHVGEPKKLTYYKDILRYYRALEAATPRVRVLSIGRTDGGRECVVVLVGSDAAMASLDEYRQYLNRLADPRGLSDEDARAIIAKARPIYHVIGGLHSSETGASEMLMELVFRLAVDDSPLMRQVRDNLIVSVTPVADPDGRDRYLDWYYAYNVDVTDVRERVPGPPYWGKYVFHDNNGDINYSQVGVRALLSWYLRWTPPIMHDLHESASYLYTFSGQAPQNPTLDPILYGEMPWFANFEMTQMTKYGMPGVWTHAFVDMWSPGYLAFMSSNHNGMIRMYETQGTGGATTMRVGTGSRADDHAGGGPHAGAPAVTTRQWYRPLPPYSEVMWSSRNSVNYMQTGLISALQLASTLPQVVLENFYLKSRNSIQSGTREAPYGYIIPTGQKDMTRAAWLVGILRLQGIEVGRATAEIRLEGGAFPRGSYVIKRDQPYGRLAKILLERQAYPDPGLRTYDDSAWTMGLMAHVEVKAIQDASVLEVPVEPVTHVGDAGRLTGHGRDAYIVPHNGSPWMITLRYHLMDLTVTAANESFKIGDVEYPAGSFVIPGRQRGEDVGPRIASIVESLGLGAVAVERRPEVETHDLDLPRVAVYSTWGSTQEAGWVRYAFDQFGVPFELIYKERVRGGDLRDSYDVIVVPNQGRGSKGLVHDLEPKDRPVPYKKSERFANLGAFGESDDITGGMGLEGVLELQRFVAEGGLLLTLGGASSVPADFGIARTVNTSRPSDQFYAPGPIVQASIVLREHPIFYGYDARTVPVRWANGPLLQTSEAERFVLMRFVGGDGAVLSGLMRGADEIRNRPAIVDSPLGKGRVILSATNPCYRWQNLGEFNMLFNALLNHNDMTTPERKSTGEP